MLAHGSPERPDEAKRASPDDGTNRAWWLLGDPEPAPTVCTSVPICNHRRTHALA